MNLLSNEMVRKYFGCRITPEAHIEGVECMECLMACKRVLSAMQAPIAKGEKFLLSVGMGVGWGEHTWEGSGGDVPFHPHWLRLPDRFQPKKECDICHRCGEPLDKAGVTEYKWDKNGGVYSCIHSFKPAPEPTTNKSQSGDELVETLAPIEEKINDILLKRLGLGQELRELVELARES